MKRYENDKNPEIQKFLKSVKQVITPENINDFTNTLNPKTKITEEEKLQNLKEVIAPKIIEECVKQFTVQWKRLLEGHLDAIEKIKEIGQRYSVGVSFKKDVDLGNIQSVITLLLYQINPSKSDIDVFMQLHALVEKVHQSLPKRNECKPLTGFVTPLFKARDGRGKTLHDTLIGTLDEISSSVKKVILLKNEKIHINDFSDIKDLETKLVPYTTEIYENENENENENITNQQELKTYDLIRDNYTNKINEKKNIINPPKDRNELVSALHLYTKKNNELIEENEYKDEEEDEKYQNAINKLTSLCDKYLAHLNYPDGPDNVKKTKYTIVSRLKANLIDDSYSNWQKIITFERLLLTQNGLLNKTNKDILEMHRDSVGSRIVAGFLRVLSLVGLFIPRMGSLGFWKSHGQIFNETANNILTEEKQNNKLF